MDTSIKGKLSDIKPVVNLNINNLNILNKSSSTSLKLGVANVNLTSDGKDYKGKVASQDVKIINPVATVVLPKANITLNQKDVDIDDCGNHKYDITRLNNNSTIKISNLDKFIIDVIEEVDIPLENKDEYFKDTEIDAVFYGWITYIVIMVFCLILNAWLFGILITSFIFFRWRKKQLKKD